MTQTDPEETGLRMLRAIRKMLRKVSRYSRQVGRDTGLSIPQGLCLRAIHDAGSATDVTVAYVADTVHLSRSTTSTLVDKLVRAALVTRERSEQDRRRVNLGLTDAGRTRLAELPAPLEARFLERLEGLDQVEQARIVQVLEQVVDLMGAEALDASPLLDHSADLNP